MTDYEAKAREWLKAHGGRCFECTPHDSVTEAESLSSLLSTVAAEARAEGAKEERERVVARLEAERAQRMRDGWESLADELSRQKLWVECGCDGET